MKKCPQCGRDYDVSMAFCLDDGTELLYGPANGSRELDEPATALLRGSELPSESPTRPQINTTNETAVLPSGITDLSKRGLDKRLIVTLLVLAIIVLGGFFGYRYFSSNSKQIESIAVMPFVNESGNPDV